MTRRIWRFAFALCLTLGIGPQLDHHSLALRSCSRHNRVLVPQVRVVARDRSTSFTRDTLTDGNGAYLITNLPVGGLPASRAGRNHAEGK
jgi:hypothetical protein